MSAPKNGLRKILWITFFWVLLAIAEFGHTYGALFANNCPLTPEQAWLKFSTALLSGVLAGLTGGILIVFIFNGWLRRLPYGAALLRILGSFSITFFGISILTGFYLHTRELDLPVTDPVVVKLERSYAGEVR